MWTGRQAKERGLVDRLGGLTDAVEAALVQCVEKKVPVVTIYSDGFAETGAAGRVKQEKLLAIARKGNVRLIGPNCIGLFSSNPPCALSVNAVLEKLDVTPGPLAIVSQSGSMMGGLLSRGLGRGVGFSKLISVGNECDLGVGEIAESLVDDPHTEAILLFMETIRGAVSLVEPAAANSPAFPLVARGVAASIVLPADAPEVVKIAARVSGFMNAPPPVASTCGPLASTRSCCVTRTRSMAKAGCGARRWQRWRPKGSSA